MQASTNYIYIIFAVAYAIYSMIKAGKKVTRNRPTIDKQGEQSPTVQPPTASPLPQQDRHSDMKKMLEDLLGVPKEEISEPQVPPETYKEKPNPQHVSGKPEPVKISLHTPQKEKPITVKEKLSSAQAKTTSAKVPAKKVYSEPVFSEEPIADFDVRQAIIYSEILKRPEY